MKNKILIILPIILLLLLASATATLTFDSVNSSVVTGGIRGMVEYQGDLVVLAFSLPNIYYYVLDTDYNIISSKSLTTSTELGSLATDGTNFYQTLSNINRPIVKRNENYTQVSVKTFPSLSASMTGITYKSGYLYVVGSSATASYIAKINYDTNTIIKVTDLTNLFPEYEGNTRPLTGIEVVGDNFYVSAYDYVAKFDDNFNVLEEPTQQIITKANYLTLFDNKYIVASNNIPQNTIYKYTSSEDYEDNYIYANGYYWNKYAECINTGSFQSYLFTNNATFSNPKLQEAIGYDLQTLGVYASANSETACSGTCVTTIDTAEDGKKYVSGSCEAGDCVAECYTYGAYMCYTDTAYRVCGDFNNDGCPEYSVLTTCPSGQICQSGIIGCATYNYSLYGTTQIPPVWYVKPDLSATQTTTYAEQSKLATLSDVISNAYGSVVFGILSAGSSPLQDYFATKTQAGINVLTEQIFSLVKFNIVLQDLDTTTYALIDCNYKESNLAISNTELNVTAVKVLSNTLSVGNTKTIIDFLPNDMSNNNKTSTTFLFYNDAPTINIILVVNTTLTPTGKNTLIMFNNEIIVNDTTPTGQTLTSITLDCDVLAESKYFSCSFKFNRATPNTYYMTPRQLLTTTNPSQNGVILIPKATGTNDTTTLYSYYVAQMPDKEALTPTTETKTHTCSYQNDGVQVMRVYHSYNQIPFYLDYKDILITNKNGVSDAGIGSVTEETEFDKLDKQLTKNEKLLIVLGVMITLFFLVMLVSKNYIQSETIPAFIGAFASIGSLLFFASVGWVPTWIIITAFILSAGIIAIVIRQKVIGA